MSSSSGLEKHTDSDDGLSEAIANPNVHASNNVTLRGWRLAVVQFSLCFGLLLSVMDTSIVATALVDIAKDFDDYIRIQWIVLSYLLTYMGFALLFSRVSDVIGRKWTVFSAFVIFTAFSLACGISQSLDQLIAFRALQGVGGVGLYSMTMTSLPEITPKERFGLMSGMIGIVFALSAVLGPILGGVIPTNSTWRWIFLLNVPCGVVALALILISWPKIRSEGHIPLKQLDFGDATLYLIGSVFLVFALQEDGSGLYAWDSPTIVAMLVVNPRIKQPHKVSSLKLASLAVASAFPQPLSS